MSLEKADELASSGRLLEAEDIYWTEIEGGNDGARLSLAYAFHDAGLISLALDQYIALKGTPHWEAAAPQVADILLDVHKYGEARDSLHGLTGESVDTSIEAIESVETKTAGYIYEVPEIVESALLEEQKILLSLGEEPDLPAQVLLTQIRENLAHYSTVLSSTFGKSIKDQSIEIGVGTTVSRRLSQAIGTPSRRWFEAAHAAVNTFTLLMQLSPGKPEDFEKIVLSAMSFIEKKYVISGRESSEDDEDFVINNLIWALNQLGHPAKDFYSHLLPA
jgi:hypothetical protein